MGNGCSGNNYNNCKSNGSSESSRHHKDLEDTKTLRKNRTKPKAFETDATSAEEDEKANKRLKLTIAIVSPTAQAKEPRPKLCPVPVYDLQQQYGMLKILDRGKLPSEGLVTVLAEQPEWCNFELIGVFDSSTHLTVDAADKKGNNAGDIGDGGEVVNNFLTSPSPPPNSPNSPVSPNFIGPPNLLGTNLSSSPESLKHTSQRFRRPIKFKANSSFFYEMRCTMQLPTFDELCKMRFDFGELGWRRRLPMLQVEPRQLAAFRFSPQAIMEMDDFFHGINYDDADFDESIATAQTAIVAIVTPRTTNAIVKHKLYPTSQYQGYQAYKAYQDDQAERNNQANLFEEYQQHEPTPTTTTTTPSSPLNFQPSPPLSTSPPPISSSVSSYANNYLYSAHPNNNNNNNNDYNDHPGNLSRPSNPSPPQFPQFPQLSLLGEVNQAYSVRPISPVSPVSVSRSDSFY